MLDILDIYSKSTVVAISGDIRLLLKEKADTEGNSVALVLQCVLTPAVAI